jgi:hypothetical protein
MVDPQAIMRQVSMALDPPQLQAKLQCKLMGCQQPQHQTLLRICLDPRERHVAQAACALIGTVSLCDIRLCLRD